MRKLFSLTLGLALVSGLLAAQGPGHNNMNEKVAKDTITFATAIRVGTTVLEAGEYRVACDREKLSFTRTEDGELMLDVPCQGTELPKAARTSAVYTKLDNSGVRYLDRLQLRGSNVDHTFQ
jgi:hypothetical protein